MKFVDEAKITVHAGGGGDGCLSFRRERCIPLGGPDGGDGGDGGNVYLQADPNINTLVDFQYQRIFKAQKGQPGEGSQCRGKSGVDLIIPVPVGTEVYDENTQEKMGDLVDAQEKLLVACGGFHGLGNVRYKSSVNRAPRQTTKGTAGETRPLKLELKVLADVGLLGLPNAGKSTLIRALSHAKPKVADYPFTTLIPQLGVVRVGPLQSFVMADLPGLIKGASQGQGLGIQFLKHLSRTQLLLHVVDLFPASDQEDDPLKAIQVIEQELKHYGAKVAQKPRWLVFNKIDLFDSEKAYLQRCNEIIKALNWQAPVFCISGVNRVGLARLSQKIIEQL